MVFPINAMMQSRRLIQDPNHKDEYILSEWRDVREIIILDWQVEQRLPQDGPTQALLLNTNNEGELSLVRLPNGGHDRIVVEPRLIP